MDGLLTVRPSPRFLRAVRKLTPQQQAETQAAINRLRQNPAHPSLRVKKVRGTDGVWEASVTMGRRFTFEYAPDGAIVIRNCNGHEILRRP